MSQLETQPDTTTASQADIDALTQTILDYAESCYSGEPDRRARVLHPALAKRTITVHPRTGRDMVTPMSVSEAIENVRAVQTQTEKLPQDQWRVDITILDVFKNVATAKSMSREWLDYIHLAKVDGVWKIINVLWQRYDA